VETPGKIEGDVVPVVYLYYERVIGAALTEVEGCDEDMLL
jgi:hypothetical protein